ncbi:zinc finger protein 501-like [Chrysoperla carnea]|uniref:zinc finger protein 501-like n=1 Tax=Chrysoperla carnea TaxID=189513 RepID=UPI001D075D2E|nr:zinc finger protein 501-like [Chrysoperla carnea]
MYNFESICRTCSCQGELQSLFIEDPLIVADMLTEIIDIKVMKGDEYPQNICVYCLEKLKIAYLFKKQCQDIQLKFERYLSSMNDKILLETNTEENYDCKDEEIYVNTVKEEELVIIHIENESNQDWNERSDSVSPAPIQSSDINQENLQDNSSNCSQQDQDSDGMKKENSDDEQESDDIKKENSDEEYYTNGKKKKSKRRKFECEVCHKNVNNLRQHMRSHTKEKPFKCDICDLEFSISSNYARHRKLHSGERPHVCEICGRGFIQKVSLVEHVRRHTNDLPLKTTCYQCDQCEKSYRLKSQLKHHFKMKHTEEGQKIKIEGVKGEFQCTKCDKKLKSKESLAHHKLQHFPKAFLCYYCGRGFVTNIQLNSHIRTHTGEKPFKCELCEKAFSQVSTYQSHQKTHTGEKPYKCEYCGKLFGYKMSLRDHQLIHTGDKPYKCNLCNQSFRQRPHLKTHYRTHSGEKPHQCTVCDKKFALNGNLTVHMRTHTGETPYVCSICNKGFYDSSSMKKHKKNH